MPHTGIIPPSLPHLTPCLFSGIVLKGSSRVRANSKGTSPFIELHLSLAAPLHIAAAVCHGAHKMSRVKAVVIQPQAEQLGDSVYITELGGGSKASKCRQPRLGRPHVVNPPDSEAQELLRTVLVLPKVDENGQTG